MAVHTGGKHPSCSAGDQTHECDRPDPSQLHQNEHSKEEQEFWTNQEEGDIISFTFTPVPVKSEDAEEEKPQFSQMETEAGGQFCAGPEPSPEKVFLDPN